MTILLARGAGDPDRIEYAVTILRPSPLAEVADAIAEYATAESDAVYVERVEDDLYRWSPATRGGSYPLLRLLARFLRCDHTELTVGFVTVDGWCVVANPGEPRSDQYQIIKGVPEDPRRALEQIGSRQVSCPTSRPQPGQ